jgi:hypothetical protein
VIGRPRSVWPRDVARTLLAGGASLRAVGRHLGVPLGTLLDAKKAGAHLNVVGTSKDTTPAAKPTSRPEADTL